MKTVTVQVPGKLMLLGEYAILEPGASALVLAINHYLYVSVSPSSKFTVSSEQLGIEDLPFVYQNERINWASSEQGKSLFFIQEALQIALQYLELRELTIGSFSLRVYAAKDIDIPSKIGVGSSAAVTVGVIAALLLRAGQSLTGYEERLRLFKLSFLAHRRAQKSGSGADISAVIFGNAVYYTGFQQDLISIQRYSLGDLVDAEPWPHLAIEKLIWPPSFRLLVGWTGQPASTHSYIQAFQHLKFQMPEWVAHFVGNSNQWVEKARLAIVEEDKPTMMVAIQQSRQLLQELREHLSLPLETEKLRILSEQAESLGGAAKFSGAGGGDCGIALLPSTEHEQILYDRWQMNGIMPFSFQVDTVGLQEIFEK